MFIHWEPCWLGDSEIFFDKVSKCQEEEGGRGAGGGKRCTEYGQGAAVRVGLVLILVDADSSVDNAQSRRFVFSVIDMYFIFSALYR